MDHEGAKLTVFNLSIQDSLYPSLVCRIYPYRMEPLADQPLGV